MALLNSQELTAAPAKSGLKRDDVVIVLDCGEFQPKSAAGKGAGRY